MSNYDDAINWSSILPNDLPKVPVERSHTYVPDIKSMCLYNRQKDFTVKKSEEEAAILFEIQSDEPSVVKKKIRK